LILENANGKPVEFHTHCTTGLGAPSCLEAIKAGIRSINTAIPPLAEASSNPSIFNVAMNARALGYSTAIDEEALKPVTEHFTAIARQENLPIGRPVEYDAFHPIHQVPGGMISNFRFQLANLGKLDQLNAVLEEVVRVRAEFGYPIMVTPYSQFVGVQAAINVMVGERYKEITDEMFQYALGHWGEEEARSIDANVRDKILSRPRAKELAKWKLPEISVKEFRAKFGGAGVSDDEKILRYFAGEDYVASMKAAAPAKDYTSTATSLVTLIRSLTQRKDTRQIFIQRKDFSLRLEQRSAVTCPDKASVDSAEAKSP
jgi:oxaloacetate decarboxylase alpha subunit